MARSPSIHVALKPDVKLKLEEYAAARDNAAQSDIIKQALDRFFDQESIDPTKSMLLSVTLDRRFSVPKIYTPQSFYATLCLNANAYPLGSAKAYWGPAVYLSELDKNNKQIFDEIRDELGISLKKARTVEEPKKVKKKKSKRKE